MVGCSGRWGVALVAQRVEALARKLGEDGETFARSYTVVKTFAARALYV